MMVTVQSAILGILAIIGIIFFLIGLYIVPFQIMHYAYKAIYKKKAHRFVIYFMILLSLVIGTALIYLLIDWCVSGMDRMVD
jgi:hypothetical protein